LKNRNKIWKRNPRQRRKRLIQRPKNFKRRTSKNWNKRKNKKIKLSTKRKGKQRMKLKFIKKNLLS
jgi:hypothetical protein